MADRAIKVAVLEGDFAALSNLGLPLSVSLQLQEMGLKLSTALWTVRSTSSGFSVSLFWPNESVTVGRRKRRRRSTKAKTLGTNAANQYLEPTASPAESPKSSKSGTTPIEAHPALIRDKSPTPTPKQSTAESQSPIPDKSPSPASNQSTADSQSPASTDESGATSDGVDLTTCSNMDFEIRDGCPGVSYHDPENVAGWTPVVGRQRRELPDFVLRRFPPDHPMRKSHSRDQSDVSSSEDEELCIPAGANVHFNIYEGTPGLQIRTRCTSSWTPIASRTRSKSKV